MVWLLLLLAASSCGPRLVAPTPHVYSDSNSPGATNSDLSPSTYVINLDHSIPDSTYYSRHLNYIQDSNPRINSWAVNISSPNIREIFPGGSLADDIPNTGINPNWGLFDSSVTYSAELFSAGVSDLREIRDTRKTDIYFPIQVQCNCEVFNWMDDSEWANVENNLARVGELIRDGGYAGIFLDPEEYGNPAGTELPGHNAFWTWKYSDSQRAPLLSVSPVYSKYKFEEVASQVRERGRRFIQILNTYQPDLNVFLMFGYSHIELTRDKSAAALGLYAYFLDGMLEGSSEGTKFVDFCEGDFSTRRFESEIRNARDLAPAYTSVNPEMYSRKMLVGLPMYRNRFDGAGFKKWMKIAEKLSGEANPGGQAYIWIYGENRESELDYLGSWVVPPDLVAGDVLMHTSRILQPVDSSYQFE